MSNRDKRRNGIPFKEEKPYTLTASQMAAQVRIETEKLRVQYEEEIKRIQKQTVEKSIKAVYSAIVLVMAENSGYGKKRLKRLLTWMDTEVWKVMNSDNDFTLDFMLENARKYGVDL
jgi:hypothetical protein